MLSSVKSYFITLFTKHKEVKDDDFIIVENPDSKKETKKETIKEIKETEDNEGDNFDIKLMNRKIYNQKKKKVVKRR